MTIEWLFLFVYGVIVLTFIIVLIKIGIADFGRDYVPRPLPPKPRVFSESK